MSEGDQPHNPSRSDRFLLASLSVAGGVVYLCLMAITAAFVASICGTGLGVAVFVVGALITFRWFSQDDDERRRKARLKRGARFACLCLGLAVGILLMAMAIPPVMLFKPERLADTMIVIASLAPLAFGIGAVTAK